MEQKPDAPTSPEASKSVLGPEMWKDCLKFVIFPRILNVVRNNGDIENRQQLHSKFCETNAVRVSYSTFSSWCEDLGITFKKRIEVQIPGWRDMPRAQPDMPPPVVLAQQAQEDLLPEEPVVWDEPRRPPSAIFGDDGLPDVLPGGMRAPSFLDNNNYGN